MPEPIPTWDEPIAFSNGVRLSAWQWLGVLAFAAALIVGAPRLWKQVEPFPFEADYRMPFDLKEDYWLYERHAQAVADRCDLFVIGDSVVWGVYVKRDETLSHYLRGKGEAANLGLIGMHPLALSGLVDHHAGAIRGKTVLLQCNPLWMTSPVLDLQDKDRPDEVFHTRLLPQFWPAIPRYKVEIDRRLSMVVEQHSNFRGWTTHLQQAYYDRTDLPVWTLAHPYENPFEPLTHELPESDNKLRQDARPWFKRGVGKQDYPWIDMETSLQWAAFRRTVDVLQARGNRVFVLVGPFNEHMLTPDSLQRYQKVKGTIAAWLLESNVPHMVPAALPSDEYGDASHPLADGYERLAKQLREDSAFSK